MPIADSGIKKGFSPKPSSPALLPVGEGRKTRHVKKAEPEIETGVEFDA